MSNDIYPDIHGNIGPQLGEIMLQTIIEHNGQQKVVVKVHKVKKPKSKPKQPWEYTVSNVIPEGQRPLLKNSPQHESFKYHPLQEPELYTCAASGYEIMCKGVKCRAHIITQKVKPLKKNELNILIICKAHEKHFNDKPLKEWYEWVKKNYPENFKSIHDNAKFVYEQLEEYFKVI